MNQLSSSRTDSKEISSKSPKIETRPERMTQPSGSPSSFPRLPQQTSSSSLYTFIVAGFRTTLWAIFHFACCFLLQVCELFAPLILIIGFGWACLPSLIGIVSKNISTVSTDPQTKDLVGHITQSIPTKLELMGHVITPHGLIFDGFLLMAGAAFCATAATWLGRRL